MKNLIFIALLFLLACEKQEENTKKEVKYDGAIITFTSITTILSEDAKIKIKLFAPLQYVQDNGNVDYPKGIQIGMYNERGIMITSLSAEKGFFDKTSQLYKATGNVVVENLERQQKLYTSELNWNQPKHEIFTEKSIRIITPTEMLEGKGLTSNEEFSNYTIWQPLGIFDIED